MERRILMQIIINLIPDIQYTLGVPLSIQFYKNLILSCRSYVQDDNGFKDRKPFSVQVIGTYCIYIYNIPYYHISYSQFLPALH